MSELTFNDFGGYWEGNAWEALGNQLEREEMEAERELAAMERISRLYQEMANEFANNGKTRRWHSLMIRAENLRWLWHSV